MFKLNEFMSSIKENGVVRSHSFDVEIPVPEYLRPKYGMKTNKLTIRCESAAIPGIVLATLDAPPKHGYGPIESIPYNIVYDVLPLTFLLDRKSYIHNFFSDWIGSMVNYRRTKGTLDESISTSNNRSGVPGANHKTYEVGYKNKYSVDGMRVNVYNEQHKKIMSAVLYKAFPKTINNVDFGWDQFDSLAKIVIPFSFRELTFEYFDN